MKQRSLTPPANRRPEDTPPPPPDLYVEPQEDLLLLGEMVHDSRTMSEMLNSLPFAGSGYRGNLRVIRGAAVRMADRCARLLGEIETKRPEASNKIDVPVAEAPAGSNVALNPELAGPDEPEPLEAVNVQPPAESDPVRKRPGRSPNETGKNGAGHPEKTGREYTTVETFVVSELKERGVLTSTELMALLAERRIPGSQTNEALAQLRKDGVVLTDRRGRGYVNHLAE